MTAFAPLGLWLLLVGMVKTNPEGLGPHLADLEVDVYVDPDDPERYAIDFHDLLMEAAGKPGRST